MAAMHLRELNIGCVGGGTGLPSLLGGLKTNPWLHLNAVVTMFDSGGGARQARGGRGVSARGVEGRPGAAPQGGRGAPRAAGTAADAGAPRQTGGTHGRQPAAVDDGAV